MSRIILLSEEITSKIAAGEVIERPAYAVKELIENAIDAGATAIRIEIIKFGLERITITDNGSGMSKEDLLLCFRPHTTSKISTIEDLIRIQSLGFRGEAIASIAAISHLSIQSRTDEVDVGFKVVIENGALIDEKNVGTPKGTIISVEQLFSSVPARKHFLKSPQTEFRHISAIVADFAFAYPSIHFKLLHNRKIVFDLPKEDNNFSRIQSLLGSDISKQLLPLQFSDTYLQIEGFIGRPQIASGSQKTHIFINGRKVTERLIVEAIKDAYSTLLEPNAIPFSLLFLSLPPETIDVNIHPKKESVQFMDRQFIYNSVKTAIIQTLQNNNLSYANASFSSPSTRAGTTKSIIAQKLRASVTSWDIKNTAAVSGQEIIQIHNCYLIVQTQNGFLLLDQHAAHERILYNQFKKAFSQQITNDSSPLLPPQFIEFSLVDIQILEEFESIFKTVGIELEIFDSNTIRVNAAPALLRDQDLKSIISQLLDDLSADKGVSNFDGTTHRMLSTLACKAAIKAGDPLTELECKELLIKLEGEENNYTCPHGRPTKIEIPLSQLDILFKRR